MPRLTLWILLMAMLLGACSPTGPSPVSTPTDTAPAPQAVTEIPSPTAEPPTATPTETVIPSPTATSTPPPPQDFGPTNFPVDVNPLTGLYVDDPTLLDRRPVAVKIQTFPRTQRPDWGVNLADIVFDYYQNNGLTRLMAVFYGNAAEKVGPVRSTRLFDDHILRMYGAHFAFGGGDQRILNRLFNSEYANRLVVEGTSSCPALCREDPQGFNFLIANTLEVGPYIESRGGDDSRPNLDGMTFMHETPQSDMSGENVYVRYSISSYVNWKYDPESGRYLRFQDSTEAHTPQEETFEPFLDRLDNQQVAADNVVILKILHQYTYKSGNSEIVDIMFGGSGEAYAFRDGKAYKLQWNRPTGSMFTLTNADGTPYAYKPGTTWIQVVGQNSTTDPTQDNGLRFEFRFP